MSFGKRRPSIGLNGRRNGCALDVRGQPTELGDKCAVFDRYPVELLLIAGHEPLVPVDVQYPAKD